MTPGARPRVLIVEDHALIRSRVTAILSPTCEIVGAVADGSSALREIGIRPTDVIVLDVNLPDMSGLDVAGRLRREGHMVPIVFLSAYDDDEFQRAAGAAGGNRYVVKSQLSELAAIVRELFAERSPAAPK